MTNPHKPRLLLTNPKNAEHAEKKDTAKEMFMSYKGLNDIAHEIGASTAQISRWRREDGWLMEREAAERGILEDGFSARKLTIARIMNTATTQLERGLNHIAGRTEPPTLPEVEKLALVLANLDRIGRLDAGKATENVNVQAKLEMTAEGIRKIIMSDPARAFEPPVTDVQPTPD